jgi:hypothetical protein
MKINPAAYIMVVRDRTYWLIGPFADRFEAGSWGRKNWDQSPGADDPRWQTIELADPLFVPDVLLPGDALLSGRVP